ncbi:MAG: hypothetical protein C0592_05630 [Marinilabiliales bacterium]|nr:MAG: hypothetical protein C0592_05630 [Marinilabiliales bacterium]
MDIDKLKNKNWNILIPYFGNELSDVALQEGIALTKVFRAGIILFRANASSEEKKDLARLAGDLKNKYNIRVESYVPHGPAEDLLFALAHKSESILILIGHDKNKTSYNTGIGRTLRKLKKSRTPFMMVPRALHTRNFKDIAYVMGYQKQEKEKILWASYFGRLYESTIHVVVPKANDQFFKIGINSNMGAMEKLYKNVEVKHINVPLAYNIHKINGGAMNYIKEQNIGAMLTLTTLRLDIFDFFGGSQEKKLICNDENIPVLCINPRDDLYVLCN